MKILLIQPPKAPTVVGGEEIHIYEPLGLEYVAAGVSGDHEVLILDMRLDKDLPALLKEFKPNVIGITAVITQVNVVKKLFREIKAWNPETLTVIGGPHATSCPQDFQVEAIDVIVAGDGVFSFQEIISMFEKGKHLLMEALDNPDEAKKKIYTAQQKVEHPDAYPFPRRELTQKYRKHYFSEWMKPLATVVTSKGCPFRCDFCCLWKFTGGKYLIREPENIVKELETIEEEYIFFADAESMVDTKRMEKLAHLIKARGIKKKYFLYSRSDTIVKSPQTFKLWRDVGLERVFIGVEFFRNDDMGVIKKGATIEDNEHALRILRDLDIDLVPSFLVLPEFSREDFKNFTKYCLELKSKFDLHIYLFSVLTPLPGTDFYSRVQSQLIVDNYDHYDLYHAVLPTRLPLKEFYLEFYKLYMNMVSFKDIIYLLRKFRLKDFPKNAMAMNNMVKKIKNVYQDY